MRKALRELHMLIESVDIASPHLGPDAQNLDSLTFQDLVAQFSRSPQLLAAANVLASSLLGVEADEGQRSVLSPLSKERRRTA